MAWGAGVANADLLINGDMNLVSISSQNNPTPTSWVATSDNGDGLSSEPWCNADGTGPGLKGVFFKSFFGDSGTPFSASLYQDNVGIPGIQYTLKGWIGSGPGYSGELPGSGTLTEFALEFLDAGSLVIGSSVLSLGTAELTAVTGQPFDYAEYTRVAIAPVGTVTVRARLSMINAYDVLLAGDPPLVTDKYSLSALGEPVLTIQPGHKSVSAGANATFTVDVSNPPATYQWQFNNVDLVNGGSVSGATTKTLTITGVSAGNVGHYRAKVSNSVGTVTSTDGTLAIVGINFYPVVTIQGKIGDTYQVDYATALAPTTWIPLSTVVLTTSPQLVTDGSSPGANTRFYRAVYQP